MAEPTPIQAAPIPNRNHTLGEARSDDEDFINQYSGSGSGSGSTISVISTTDALTTTRTTTTTTNTTNTTATRDFHLKETPPVTTSPVSVPPPDAQEQDIIPIIAAVACGAFVIMVIIVAVIIFCRRRKLSSQPKESVDSKPPPYSSAVEMSATRRSTLEVRPVNTVTYPYSAAESVRNVNPRPSAGETRPTITEPVNPTSTQSVDPSNPKPVDRQTSSKTSNGQSNLDDEYQNERYSKLTFESSRKDSSCNKYENLYSYENTSMDNGQPTTPTEISENPYDDIEGPNF